MATVKLNLNIPSDSPVIRNSLRQKAINALSAIGLPDTEVNISKAVQLINSGHGVTRTTLKNLRSK